MVADLDPALTDPATVPSVVDVSAYRIVQEGLTNAVKHGAEPREAHLSVIRGPRELRVEVRNRAASRPGEGSRLGLLGIRERVEVLGGRLEHGVEDGWHRLTVTVPTASADFPAHPAVEEPA